MVSSVKNDSRNFYAFVYKNILVNIPSNTDLFGTDIFQNFLLMKSSCNNKRGL